LEIDLGRQDISWSRSDNIYPESHTYEITFNDFLSFIIGCDYWKSLEYKMPVVRRPDVFRPEIMSCMNYFKI